MAYDAASVAGALGRLPPLPPPELSGRAEAALAQAVALAMVPSTARQAVPDRALAMFVGPARSQPAIATQDGWDVRRRAMSTGPAVSPPAAAVMVAVRNAADWGSRGQPPALPAPAAASEARATPAPPYGAAAAGALAGIAATARLLRHLGMGDHEDSRVRDRLGRTIAAFDATTTGVTMPEADGQNALLAWAGVARQTAFLRKRFGLDPLDPEQLGPLADASRERARWLADRPYWPERETGVANLLRWSPLVDCAETFERPTRGDDALRQLGAAIRTTAAVDLPALREPMRTAQLLAFLDAWATIREVFGIESGDPAATTRLRAAARSLERLPDAPPADTTGAIDRSCLERLRELDRGQSDALGLDDLGQTGVPFVTSGLPVLATWDVLARLRGAGPPLISRASGRPAAARPGHPPS